ncbi:helix-turn-helix domain-containing protein [Alcanivorax sp. IO_7]|nr:helix-turn-helix domain-containing protein [Alcanivorax sp. IO_7]
MRKLGEDIREARLRRNLSMEIVAERAATSRATLTRLEKGTRR